MRFSLRLPEFPGTLATPTVLFQHNVESALWQRMATTESNPVRRFAYQIEARKMSRYERRALRKFHHVIAVSEHDRQQMLAMDPSCSISVVPTGRGYWQIPARASSLCQSSTHCLHRFHGLGAEHRCHRLFLPGHFPERSDRVPGCSVSSRRPQPASASQATRIRIGGGYGDRAFRRRILARRNRRRGAAPHWRRNAAEDF